MIHAYIDGGSRGNPGPAGYGVRVEDHEGQLIDEFYEAIGIETNNTAEYRGLIAVLEYAIRSNLKRITIKSDSQLLVKQMHGDYRVRHPRLRLLHSHATTLTARLDHVTFEHIPRSLNTKADRLANLAMDKHTEIERPSS
jgi:probable phosphoglycerate mutase